MSDLSINDQLIITAQNNNIDKLQLLIQNGADPTYNNSDALQWAARNGNSEIVKILLPAGANPQANNNNALRWAQHNDHTDIVNILNSVKTVTLSKNNINSSILTLPINTLPDLRNVPEWIFEALTPWTSYIDPYRPDIYELEPKLNTFNNQFFNNNNLITFDNIQKFWYDKNNNPNIKDLYNVNREQLKYLYNTRAYLSSKQIRIGEIERSYTNNNINKYRQSVQCNIWIIAASLNDVPYGAIFVFQNINNPDDVMMQGIAKFPIPGIFSLMYPDLVANLPKLNSLLIPAVEKLASNLNAKRIIVAPVGKQDEILQKYYGFKRINNVEPICAILLGDPHIFYGKNIL